MCAEEKNSGSLSNKTNRFSKAYRLLKPNEFQWVFDAVDCKQGGKYFTFLSRSNTLNNSRLGLVISKRQLQLAVNRNRIKRAIRECFRKQFVFCPTLDSQFDVIVLAKSSIKQLDQATLNQELEKQWLKLITKRKVLSPN